MFETLKRAFKIKEIRVKIFITLLFLILYRLGCYIPVPGIGGSLFESLDEAPTYLGIMSMMTGGALMNGTWFAMGIGPYINSSIIIQLLTVAIPKLERLSKEGESGRRKISNITRYVAVLLAIIQSIGILLNYGSDAFATNPDSNYLSITDILFGQKWLAYTITVLFYTSGALVVVWIGERITDYGVSNGISLLIFAGILSTAGLNFISMIRKIAAGGDAGMVALWRFIAYIVVIVLIFAFIVYVDGAERKVKVNYAKQVKGRKMMGGQSTEIPIKVNANGVMPLIFAFSIVSFPELIMSMFWPEGGAISWWQKWMGTDSWVYMIVLCLLIFFFAFFYAQIQFNPEDVSKSIQQNGGFIQGIRPGRATCEHLGKISKRITLFGAIFLALLALIPSIIFRYIDPTTSSIFTATGMLIAVSVALEFNTALESQIMMKNYKGFLK